MEAKLKKLVSMYNKYIQFAFVIICIFGLLACKRIGTNSKRTTISISDGKITISDEYRKIVNLQLFIGDEIKFTKEINVGQETSILSLIKTNRNYYNDIALQFAKNDGDIQMNLKLENVLDTTFTYHLDINNTLQYTTKVLTGNCASISSTYESANAEEDIIKWLFRNNKKNVGEETINKMRLYVHELNRTSYNEYITRETIPVITSFNNIYYKLSSNLYADNYYLYACKSEKEIEDFIEEMVSLKFEGAAHSLNQPISCYRSVSTSGTICIFLIGIDNDWSYRLAPVGLVCIDNIKPTIKPNDFPIRGDIVLNKNKIKIRIPSRTPSITGYASISTRDFGGDGISCKVNFSLSFGGDVKSLTFIREGALTYKNSYISYVGDERKIIDLQKETSPLFFSYELHLEEGDNYLPVIITDLRGNTTEFKYNIPAHFKRSNAPSINIDNDVNVYN